MSGSVVAMLTPTSLSSCSSPSFLPFWVDAHGLATHRPRNKALCQRLSGRCTWAHQRAHRATLRRNRGRSNGGGAALVAESRSITKSVSNTFPMSCCKAGESSQCWGSPAFSESKVPLSMQKQGNNRGSRKLIMDCLLLARLNPSSRRAAELAPERRDEGVHALPSSMACPCCSDLQLAQLLAGGVGELFAEATSSNLNALHRLA